ncbi:hypothetical protein KR018_008808, partial [Drosophila ironensis]
PKAPEPVTAPPIFEPPKNDSDYRLFPEIYDLPPLLPTFIDIFGQPSYGFGSKANSNSNTNSNSNSNSSTDNCCHENGIRSTDDGRFSNIPSSMLGDRFGMTGLLAAMRATLTNPSATQLVFGEDLTTFGLDLAAQGDIYVHFNGPLTHEPPPRSSMDRALELGMRAMRDAMVRYPTKPPVWDPFVPATGHLGLVGGGGKDGSTESDSESDPRPEVLVGSLAPASELGRDQESDRKRDRKE